VIDGVSAILCGGFRGPFKTGLFTDLATEVGEHMVEIPDAESSQAQLIGLGELIEKI